MKARASINKTNEKLKAKELTTKVRELTFFLQVEGGSEVGHRNAADPLVFELTSLRGPPIPHREAPARRIFFDDVIDPKDLRDPRSIARNPSCSG